MWFENLKNLPPENRQEAIAELPAMLDIWADQYCEYRYRGQNYKIQAGLNSVPRSLAVWLLCKGKPFVSDQAPQAPAVDHLQEKVTKRGRPRKHNDQ
ncbi:MAG: hypothetical protein PHV11_06305 [Candidatus Bipolaricaulis sp.]|nr:hypothetical protein [Candidatus Bipolaricaulis sp.]